MSTEIDIQLSIDIRRSFHGSLLLICLPSLIGGDLDSFHRCKGDLALCYESRNLDRSVSAQILDWTNLKLIGCLLIRYHDVSANQSVTIGRTRLGLRVRLCLTT